MSSDPTPTSSVIELTIAESSIATVVLERLVSAAATRAELSIDRIVSALAAIDALSTATDRVVDAGMKLNYSITIDPGRLRLSVDGLRDGQADELIDAAALPEVGNVLERMSDSVHTERNAAGTSLVLSFT